MTESSSQAKTLRERFPIQFTHEDSERAFDEWGFNCGPGALCAVLNLTPDQIRPYMGDFERKGYTNPTLMYEILSRLEIPHKTIYRSDNPDSGPFRSRETGQPNMQYGLMRVQWGGPWTATGVPMQARYRATHWVGVRWFGAEIFDINAVCEGDHPLTKGWLPYAIWADKLIPWLLEHCQPKADGTWWPTHAIEVGIE